MNINVSIEEIVIFKDVEFFLYQNFLFFPFYNYMINTRKLAISYISTLFRWSFQSEFIVFVHDFLFLYFCLKYGARSDRRLWIKRIERQIS